MIAFVLKVYVPEFDQEKVKQDIARHLWIEPMEVHRKEGDPLMAMAFRVSTEQLMVALSWAEVNKRTYRSECYQEQRDQCFCSYGDGTDDEEPVLSEEALQRFIAGIEDDEEEDEEDEEDEDNEECSNEEEEDYSIEEEIILAEAALYTMSKEYVQNIFGDGVSDVVFDALNEYIACRHATLTGEPRE